LVSFYFFITKTPHDVKENINMTAMDEILRLCEELPVGSLSARKKETARVAREFQNPEYSEQILTDFREEIKNGSPVSANYNPNGFYKIRLFKTGNTALRLHIDDPDSGIPEGGEETRGCA